MSSAPRLIPKYSSDDYLKWEGDWQLIDGIAIAMTPSPFGRHEQIVANCVYELMAAIRNHSCECRVYAGLDWIVNSHTVLRPDVMVVCGEQPSRHLNRRPHMVIEVLSPSTAEQDLGVKREIYAEQGVAYYLIIDPDTNRLQLFESVAAHDKQTDVDDRVYLRLAVGCELELFKEQLLR